MGVLEIVLLMIGAGAAVAGFVIPAKKDEVSSDTRELAKEEIKVLVEKEMDAIRSHVDDVVDEAVGYAVEKTERSLERLTNEKIMAVNEYSDTVLKEIHKNHEETMFLYDMLNDKHTSLKNTVSEVNKTVQEVEETKREAREMVNTFQQLAPEPVSVEPEKVIKELEVIPEKKPRKKAGTKKKENDKLGDLDLTLLELGQDFAQNEPANHNEQILEMHRQGKSNVAIAKALGLGVGEVKLVIDLHKNM